MDDAIEDDPGMRTLLDWTSIRSSQGWLRVVVPCGELFDPDFLTMTPQGGMSTIRAKKAILPK